MDALSLTRLGLDIVAIILPFRRTLNVPHVSFAGNLASDTQSVALSDGKIKVKATVSEQSWYEVCLLPVIEGQTILMQ
jgi:predicted membrane protein